MYEDLVEKLIEIDEAEIPGNELALIRSDGEVLEFSRFASHEGMRRMNPSFENSVEYWLYFSQLPTLALRFYEQPTSEQFVSISKLVNASSVIPVVLEVEIEGQTGTYEPFPRNWSALVRKLYGKNEFIDKAKYMEV